MSDMFSSGVTRTFGLSGSGIDVDSMVQQLMNAAKKPYDSLQQKETLLEWKKSDYYTMYTSLSDFRSKNVFNFNMKNTLDAKTVTATNTNAVSVTANSDAVNVNHTISVSRLASGATQSSSDKITTGTDKTTLASQFGINGTVDFTINGTEIKVNSSQSINDLVSAINKANVGVTATYDTNQDRFFLYTSATGTAAKIDFTGSSSSGLSFIKDNLKLSALSTVTNGGTSSASYIGVNDSNPLAGQFVGLAGSFNLKMTVDGVQKTIAIDTATTNMNDVVTSINAMKDSSGNQLAYASIGADGKVSLKAAAGQNIDLTGSDSAAIDFMNNQLQLGVSTATPINSTGVTSTASVFFDQTAALNTSLGMTISAPFTMRISDGTTTKSVTVDMSDPTKDGMDDLINNINALTDANGKQLAVASFEHGRFTLKAAQSGVQLDLSDSDATATSFLNNQLSLMNQQGQDATFKLDGMTMTQASNKFTIAGITYNLQGTGTSNITVANDIDKIVNSVKTFISDYNALLSTVTTKVTEAYDRNYLPLTDDQKSAMKDNDISLWTTKAKTGLLHNDSILQTLRDSMRNAFSSAVSGIDGNYKSATSLGISTSSDWTENGKLYLDENALRAALQSDPEAVYKVFGTDGADSSKDGIAVRLNDLLKTATDNIASEAGTTASTTSDTTSVLGKQAKDYTKQLSDMFKKLQTKEQDYYTKYSNMETALAKLNQQTSQLSSLLGS
ncbi:MAG: flagellar filament capping protein FliD [Sporomusaceae bacterium]|nr:flagellar filament capping protein FliD [Sporomusaceae bacterium]